mmetsp:Transcript_103339/g.333338  ORF Transcript_103339/g.333338 Transcript_103339/m.333338 type:complete len:347 (-) Transcript_103339:77-1117(-)
MWLRRSCGFVTVLVPITAVLLRKVVTLAICGTYVRKFGTTKFADPAMYDEVVLPEERKREYFRDGVTVVRGALRPELLQELLQVILQSTNPLLRYTGGFASNLWMRSDAYLDFLVYSNLGHLAAQIFASPDAETASAPRAAYMWRDFLVERNRIQGRFLAWHVDKDECEGDLPASLTARSRLRFVIPLADNVLGTVFVNQSAYVAAMEPEEAERYWRGELPRRACGTHCGDFWWGESPPLPRVSFPAEGATIHTGRMRLGDVIVFSACAWHRSPGISGQDLHFVLQPAFAPASSRIFGRIPLGCRHNLSIGEPLTGSPSCFPQAYPREAWPAKGTVINLQSAFHWC